MFLFLIFKLKIVSHNVSHTLTSYDGQERSTSSEVNTND